MQIRIANRQDEAPIRALLEKQGTVLDLKAADRDLHNIDQGYFAHDGLLLVAEAEGEIIAIAGARQSANDKSVLQVIRLAPQSFLSGTAGGAIRERFISIIRNHAYQMDFNTVQVPDELAILVS